MIKVPLIHDSRFSDEEVDLSSWQILFAVIFTFRFVIRQRLFEQRRFTRASTLARSILVGEFVYQQMLTPAIS